MNSVELKGKRGEICRS